MGYGSVFIIKAEFRAWIMGLRSRLLVKAFWVRLMRN